MGQVDTVLVGSKTLMREGLKQLLAGSPIQISGEAVRLADVSQTMTNGHAPDLVLFDVTEFQDEAAQGVRELKQRYPRLKLVMLTDVLDAGQLSASLAAGVDGYLMKEISCEALLQSLRLVMLGEKVFPTDLATLLVNGTPTPPRSGKRVLTEEVKNRGLSERELQILQCLAQGDSNKTIANRLDITEATVKVHVKSLLRKIQASNRTQAAIWAVNQGLA
ncbi:MAG: response regulator transcription factor [Alphaproteobacteria bacterium]